MPFRKPKPLDQDAMMSYALRALGGRAHSLGEIREKLQRRCLRAEDVDAVITRLKEAGYLNDQQFAQSFATARLENEGFGKMRVLRDLRQHRVAPKLAEQVVQKTFEASDEVQLIENFLARKYRGKSLRQFLSEEKNLASAFRRLQYAGFSAGNSIRVLKGYAREPEVLDSLDEGSSEDDAV
jgi:regulatory protein